MSLKPIAIRPTDIIQQYIDSEIQKDKQKPKSERRTKTGIIIEVLEKAISHSGPEGQPPSQIPTGILVKCPIRPTSVPICAATKCAFRSSVIYAKAEVDSSVCKTCPKYPCETWEWIFSEKRLFPNSPTIKNIEQSHGTIP